MQRFVPIEDVFTGGCGTANATHEGGCGQRGRVDELAKYFCCSLCPVRSGPKPCTREAGRTRMWTLKQPGTPPKSAAVRMAIWTATDLPYCSRATQRRFS